MLVIGQAGARLADGSRWLSHNPRPCALAAQVWKLRRRFSALAVIDNGIIDGATAQVRTSVQCINTSYSGSCPKPQPACCPSPRSAKADRLTTNVLGRGNSWFSAGSGRGGSVSATPGALKMTAEPTNYLPNIHCQRLAGTCRQHRVSQIRPASRLHRFAFDNATTCVCYIWRRHHRRWLSSSWTSSPSLSLQTGPDSGISNRPVGQTLPPPGLHDTSVACDD